MTLSLSMLVFWTMAFATVVFWSMVLVALTLLVGLGDVDDDVGIFDVGP